MSGRSRASRDRHSLDNLNAQSQVTPHSPQLSPQGQRKDALSHRVPLWKFLFWGVRDWTERGTKRYNRILLYLIYTSHVPTVSPHSLCRDTCNNSLKIFCWLNFPSNQLNFWHKRGKCGGKKNKGQQRREAGKGLVNLKHQREGPSAAPCLRRRGRTSLANLTYLSCALLTLMSSVSQVSMAILKPQNSLGPHPPINLSQK